MTSSKLNKDYGINQIRNILLQYIRCYEHIKKEKI